MFCGAFDEGVERVSKQMREQGLHFPGRLTNPYPTSIATPGCVASIPAARPVKVVPTLDLDIATGARCPFHLPIPLTWRYPNPTPSSLVSPYRVGRAIGHQPYKRSRIVWLTNIYIYIYIYKHRWV